MAGGGENGEMNPFISYVDLFSSVILVLLLFVLIMFVNVGYYMQFNSKDAKVVTEQNITEESVQDVSPQRETKKEDYKEKQKMVSSAEETNNTTPVQGGEVEGNVVSKKTEKTAIAEFQESDMLIIFKNNEYFLSKDVIRQASEAMGRVLKTKPNAVFFVSVGDSKKLISSTQTKQVSLGRVLSLKNSLDAVPELKNKIKINYKQSDQSGFEFGYLKIDVK